MSRSFASTLFPSSKSVWCPVCVLTTAISAARAFTRLNRAALILFTISLIGKVLSQITMLSVDQAHIINPGDSVSLECRFHSDQYNLFDFPVLWKKVQLEDDIQVNIMGNINDPFLSSNRFEAIFTPTPPRFNLQLSISDAVIEDSGNYTCEVRGPQSIVLRHITHYLYVRAPVTMLILSKAHTTDQENVTLVTLHLVENRPSVIRCDSLGGYPPPSIDMYIGRRDVTRYFAFRSSCVKVFGPLGNRRLIYAAERSTYNFMPLATDDQQTLSCVATVPGLKPVIENVKLDVDYSPKLDCAVTSEATLFDTEVSIECEVDAKPLLTDMFWILDTNGTILREGEFNPDYWTVLTEKSKMITRVKLYIRLVKRDSFRKYTIVCENKVAIVTRDVQLVERFETTEAPWVGVSSKSLLTGNRETSRDLGRRSYFHMRSDVSSSKCVSCLLLVVTFAISRTLTIQPRFCS